MATVVTAVAAKQTGRTSERVSWKDGANNTLNEIYRAPSASFGASKIIGIVPQAVQIFKDSGLTPGTIYYYYVRGRAADDSIASAVGPGSDTTLGNAGDPGDTLVQQIIQAMQTRIADVLPTVNKELEYVYDLSKNQKLGNVFRFGVRAADARPGRAQVFGAYTQEKNFEVIFMEGTSGGSDDKNTERAVFDMEPWVDRIIREFKASHLYLPTIALLVADPSSSRPVPVPGTEAVAITVTFPIQFRNTLKL